MMSPGNAIALIEKIIAAAEHKDAKEQLKQYSASLNIKNASGETPLIVALRGGKPKAAAALIEAGADVTDVDNVGSTPLHLAAAVGSPLLATLIEKKANLEVRNDRGRSPFHVAIAHAQAEAAATLLEAGADATVVDKYRTTTLHSAAQSGLVTIIPVLIAKGVKLEAINQFEQYPLLAALVNGKIETAVALLEAGADATVVDSERNTALNWAVKDDLFEIIPTLIARRANVDATLQSVAAQKSKYGYKLLFIFKTVQGCFNAELMQRMAKYMEILLLENKHQSLLTIDSSSLLEFVNTNFDKIADIFFEHFNALLEQAQTVLKDREIDMDIGEIHSLLTQTLIGHIATLLTPKKTAATWYHCMNLLLCESNDAKPVFTDATPVLTGAKPVLTEMADTAHIAHTTMPGQVLRIIHEYVCFDPFQNHSQGSQNETQVSSELFRKMEAALGLQDSKEASGEASKVLQAVKNLQAALSDASLNGRLLEQRLLNCCKFLVGRRQKSTAELPSVLTPEFPSVFPPEISPERLLCFYSLAPQTPAPKSSVVPTPGPLSGSSVSPLYDLFRRAEKAVEERAKQKGAPK